MGRVRVRQGGGAAVRDRSAAAPLGLPSSLRSLTVASTAGGSQQHGEGMRNQDLAGRNQADRAEKSPALLHPSAHPVLGRGGRGVLALVMGTAWGQPCWWWPLSIPGSPITLPPPPTPPNAGFKELQGDGDVPGRLCQSNFFGDLMVTPLPGAALCPEHLLPTLL